MLRLGKPYFANSAVSFNIVQTAFDSPIALNMYVANFFEQLLKKWFIVWRDKIQQNNA